MSPKDTNFSECCAKEIQRLWMLFGGSMNIVSYSGYCPECGKYIGITQTNEEDAVNFLKQYGIENDIQRIKTRP